MEEKVAEATSNPHVDSSVRKEDTSCDPNILRRDQYFLLIDNKENRRFCTVNQKKINVNRMNINLVFFENKPLNTFWEIEDDKNIEKYTLISHKDFFVEDFVESEESLDYQNENIIKHSNKEIYSISEENAQKLTENDISELKAQGLSGDEIIKIILKNNTTMEKRTTLSQEKIIKKKERKHRYKIWITPTSLMNCVETFFIDSPAKLNNLRMDSISTILNYVNLGENNASLIYEETNGFLTTALAQRCSTNSNIVALFDKKINSKNNCILNLKEEEKWMISYVKREYLVDPESRMFNFFSHFYTRYFENLIICLKPDEHNLLHICFGLMPYLKLCGMIVIFASQLQVLISIEKYLFEHKLAIDIKIHETYTREYQILTLRTHPTMNNKGYSGYVLTAIKVEKS